MDCSLSTPSTPLDELDEPQAPPRSPSRLDFCMENLENGGTGPEVGGDSEMHGLGFAYTPLRGDRLYSFHEEALMDDTTSPGCSRILVVEDAEDDPPQAKNSHSHKNADTSHTPSMPREHPMDQVIIEPRSPIPVRPLSVQFDLDAREVMPPLRTAPHRLSYPHHGFSRSALQQQKTLWNSRHEEWAEWHSRMERAEAQKQESDAYAGLVAVQPRLMESPPPYMRAPPSGLERDLADHPPRKHEQDVHASIFPRVGDISALRNPYSVDVDRCFFKFPLWTLHKMLYMFDMHQRSASLAPSTSVCNLAHIQASTSSSTLGSYASSASGDEESETTLVADDSPIPLNQFPCEPLKHVSSPHSPSSRNRLRGWEFSWYARWELLLSLFQCDHTMCEVLGMSTKSAEPIKFKTAPLSPPRPIFRFNVGEDGDNEDEDEDYGMVVPDPTFSVDFNEECERALAFFSRESKHPEMAS